MSNWLEVSLTVNGELAEAVAEVLARYAPQGVVIESTRITDERDGPGHPSGPLRVCAYLPADDQLEEQRQRLLESLSYLGMISPLPEPEFKTIADENWMENWKQHYRPILVGEKLLILPSWMENPNPERIPIQIEPGMAFGTGTHPTTQLSLTLLERYILPGQPLLDIGCGSGILSIAAHKLGAQPIVGVDIDAPSIENAAHNARLNDAETILFEAGSVNEVLNGDYPLQTAPVVVANILTHILIRLLEDGMGELVSPGGVLLLSGILNEREPELLAVLEARAFKIEERLQMEDWVGLAARPKN